LSVGVRGQYHILLLNPVHTRSRIDAHCSFPKSTRWKTIWIDIPIDAHIIIRPYSRWISCARIYCILNRYTIINVNRTYLCCCTIIHIHGSDATFERHNISNNKVIDILMTLIQPARRTYMDNNALTRDCRSGETNFKLYSEWEREREREIIREKVGQGKETKTSTTYLAYTVATHRFKRAQVYLCALNGVYIIHT